VLFSHPAGYTPVCTTESWAKSRAAPEWRKRKRQNIALRLISARKPQGAGIGDINETQSTSVDYPILAMPINR